MSGTSGPRYMRVVLALMLKCILSLVMAWCDSWRLELALICCVPLETMGYTHRSLIRCTTWLEISLHRHCSMLITRNFSFPLACGFRLEPFFFFDRLDCDLRLAAEYLEGRSNRVWSSKATLVLYSSRVSGTQHLLNLRQHIMLRTELVEIRSQVSQAVVRPWKNTMPLIGRGISRRQRT